MGGMNEYYSVLNKVNIKTTATPNKDDYKILFFKVVKRYDYVVTHRKLFFLNFFTKTL